MQKNKRNWLTIFSILIVLIVMIFLFVVNFAQPKEAQEMLNVTLLISGSISIVALIIFCRYADVVEDDGTLQKNNILFILISIICVLQLTLFFAAFSYQLTDFSAKSLDQSNKIYEQVKVIQEETKSDDLSSISLPNEISKIYFVKSDKSLNPLEVYQFPMNNKILIMEINNDYKNDVILKIVIDLLSVLVASILLSIELCLFAIKFIEDKFQTKKKELVKKDYAMVRYVREIAFLFYFASRMSTSFITLLAKDLGGSFLGFDGNVLAGLPQSSEFLFTCISIFFTSMILEKKGWKPSFIGGLIIVMVGTLLSAFSVNITMFIISRGVVGLGYGFCWMTLRGFALFSMSEKGKTLCFALLNAGIYSGMNCGSIIGGIMADIMGYIPVLIISSILTLFCVFSIHKMRNVVYSEKMETKDVQSKITLDTSNHKVLNFINTVSFSVLLIIPSCILGSFLGYFLPIYLSGLGGQSSDIARMQLLYGLAIVYIGPIFVKLIQKHFNPMIWNLLYNLLFSITLIFFGAIGGFAGAAIAVLFIGFSDSFGFVVQNNYFLEFPISKKLGHNKALSLLSVIKKLAEMLGPVIFGFMFFFGDTKGVQILGIVFAICTFAYGYTFLLMRKRIGG